MRDADATADLAALTAAVRELTARIDSQGWPRWLSVACAVRYCSISEKSVRNLVVSGKLTPSRAVRGKVLIDKQQLDAALHAERGKKLRKGRGIRN